MVATDLLQSSAVKVAVNAIFRRHAFADRGQIQYKNTVQLKNYTNVKKKYYTKSKLCFY